MKNTELRIGNLVYDFTDHCNVNILAEDLTDVSNFKPIPLTEEWLLKFGFDAIFSNELWKDSFGYSLESKGLGLQYSYDEGTFRVYCEYIHQLQNLYFSLTGEELTIN